MMRPGANVKMPRFPRCHPRTLEVTRAPVKIAIIAWRCRSTRSRRACMTASGSESRWIGLQGPPHAQLMDEERAHGHDHHQRGPQPTDGTMGQRTFGRAELDRADCEGSERREGMQLDGGSGVQERRQRHGSRMTAPKELRRRNSSVEFE